LKPRSKQDGSGAAVRAQAARCITAVLDGTTLDQALAEVPGTLAERDRPLLRELCYGSLRSFPRLDAVLGAMLRQPLRRRDRLLRALALVGLYQLSATRIPPHAAVNATVEATGTLRLRAGRGLLNAVLRRYQRERETLEAALPAAARAAQPAWLWEALGREWPQHREQIAEASNAHPPLTLRVNRLRGSRDDYLRELAGAGIEAQAGALSEDAVTLAQAVDVSCIPGFSEGRVSVQDEAAQLAAGLLAPQPGERILDACAAPGGKTGHLLELLGGDGEVTAVDVSPERLQRVAANLQRLGLEAQLLCADLTDDAAPLQDRGPFDAILLDVPCSATGVIRRHPDIKLLRRASDIEGFAAKQRVLLETAWALLRPGGRLLYVTCSLLAGENQALLRAFLDGRGDAREADIAVPRSQPCAPGRQLLPGTAGADGLYFALLEKSPETGP